MTESSGSTEEVPSCPEAPVRPAAAREESMTAPEGKGTVQKGSPPPSDFGQAPFLVIWELTRACALACVHCRAEAVPQRDPRELTTEEGIQLLSAVASFGPPHPLLVFTGGDPMRRPDVYELVSAGTERGLRVALTPSGTAAVRRTPLARLQAAGLARLAVSLDGSTPGIHDAFRGVRGSWEWTMRILREARELGLPLQVNTTVTRHNRADLAGLAACLESVGIVLWSVFFLVPTGRARLEDGVSAEDYEAILNDLYDLAGTVPFGIKTTEAPHYRRVVAERRHGIRWDGRASHGEEIRRTPLPAGIRAGPATPRGDAIGRAGLAVNDGNGFVFVDHVGEVMPSGFLPLGAGNVRTGSLVSIYRDHDLFRQLRDPDRLRGRCGRCEYRRLCGGSRARAYAMTGDYLAEDPCCLYNPPNDFDA
jgi:radical SAM protein